MVIRCMVSLQLLVRCAWRGALVRFGVLLAGLEYDNFEKNHTKPNRIALCHQQG
jgi:hypothetical protein